MKFLNYQTTFDAAKQHLTYEQYIAVVNARHLQGKLSKHMKAIIVSEIEWRSHVQPYFKVWPSIIPALSRITLAVRLRELDLGSRVVAIRFPELSAPVIAGEVVQSILVSRNPEALRVVAQTVEDGKIMQCTATIRDDFIGTVEDDICSSKPVTDFGVVDNPEVRNFAMRCALTTLLLANDPSFIRPDVIAADREKFDETGDLKYVEKARKRGIVGWRIGEEYESMPHYRRPHLALRHTGKGRTIPRIVPVRGAIVHRDKMTRVPTGYITPDGVEVEP